MQTHSTIRHEYLTLRGDGSARTASPLCANYIQRSQVRTSYAPIPQQSPAPGNWAHGLSRFRTPIYVARVTSTITRVSRTISNSAPQHFWRRSPQFETGAQPAPDIAHTSQRNPRLQRRNDSSQPADDTIHPMPTCIALLRGIDATARNWRTEQRLMNLAEHI